MSLRARLLAAFAYTLLVVIVALEVPLATNLDDRVNAEVEADSAAQAQVTAATIADGLRQQERLEQVTTEASDRLGGRVFIVNGHGILLADSAGEAPIGSQYASPEHPPLLDALNGEVAQGRHPPNLDVLSTAVPIVRRGRTIGALEVEQDTKAVSDEVRQDIVALIGVGLLALALGLGVAWILAGSLTRPINALARVARRMATGDLSARADPRGSSEQVEVARAFNEMADRLEGMLDSQREFVADASHQLRTPLTGLRLRLEAARAKIGDAAADADLEAAELETERLTAVLSDLLALASSEEEGEPGETDLDEAVAAAERRWRDPAAESGHELVVDGGPGTLVTTNDRGLALILDNLIENALKYSPRGSAVEVGWGVSDDSAVLTVLNGGGRLPDEELKRAFERFYRGESGRRKQGTGLGLPIVAALARRAGGSARLVNRDDASVAAEVTLPRPALPTPNPRPLR